MASALDAVLRIRTEEEAKRQKDVENITNAVDMLQKARQSSIENHFEELRYKAGLAEKGLVPDSTQPSGFRRDSSLEDPMTKFMQGLKIQAEAKTANNPQAYLIGQAISGLPQVNPSTPSVAINNPIGSAAGTISQNAPQQTSTTIDTLKQQSGQKDVFGELTPEAKSAQEQLKADAAPLAGDTASKFAGAEQGIKNIKETIDFINNYKGDKKDLIVQANKVVEAANANSQGLAGFIPGGKAIYRAEKLAGTSEEAKVLANKLSTVAENLLRARTGAAATQDEINREFSRSLLMTINEGPSGWNQKLKNNYSFLKNTFDEIRPLRKDNPEFNLQNEIQPGEKQSLSPEQASAELQQAKWNTNPLAIAASALDIGSRPAINASTFGGANLLSNLTTGKPYVQPNTPNSTLLSLLGGFGAIGAASKVNRMLQVGQAAEKAGAASAQSALTRLKGDEIINTAVKNARESLTSKSGYISEEHNIYAKAIDEIKGSENVVKGADDLLTKFKLNNTNEITGQFNTPEMSKVYESLSKKFANGEKITEADIVNSMKALKGKFGAGKVDAVKRMNLNAASDLSGGLSGQNSKILNNANIRYSGFKNNEKNIDELIGIYGKAKKTDSVVGSLLSKDLGIEQSKVAQLIGDKTNLDLLNTINYYRGLNQVKDSFWITRQIDAVFSGVKKAIKSKAGEVPPKK